MPEDIRCIIVEDHEIVRSGLRKLLSREEGIRVVAEYSSPMEALAWVTYHAPDIVLMDVRMPAMDGLTATRELHKRNPDVPVIILTMFEEYMTAAFEAGAAGFLQKDLEGDELADSIRRVVAGELVISRSLQDGSASGQEPASVPGNQAAPFGEFPLADGRLVCRVKLRILPPGGGLQAARFATTLVEELDATLLQSFGSWDDYTVVRIELPKPIAVPTLLSQVQRRRMVVHTEDHTGVSKRTSGLLGALPGRRREQEDQDEATLLIVLEEPNRVEERKTPAGHPAEGAYERLPGLERVPG